VDARVKITGNQNYTLSAPMHSIFFAFIWRMCSKLPC